MKEKGGSTAPNDAIRMVNGRLIRDFGGLWGFGGRLIRRFVGSHRVKRVVKREKAGDGGSKRAVDPRFNGHVGSKGAVDPGDMECASSHVGGDGATRAFLLNGIVF